MQVLNDFKKIVMICLLITSFICSYCREKEIIVPKISEKEILKLDKGDYVCPRLSPNGEYLALSEVIGDSSYENTQILLVDLHTYKVDTILTSGFLLKFGVYASFVREMKWITDKLLKVLVSDGDVGYTDLIVDIFNHKITDESHFDDTDYLGLSLEYKKLAIKMIKLYPELIAPKGWNDIGVIESGLNDNPIIIDRKGVILQTRFYGFDRNIWYYSLKNKHSICLLDTLIVHNPSLGGGATFNESTAFVYTDSTKAILSIFSDNKISKSMCYMTMTKEDRAYLIEISRLKNGLWLNLKLYPPYEKGGNPILWFNGNTLSEIKTNDLIFDFDINQENKMIALCFWNDDKRNIVLKGYSH